MKIRQGLGIAMVVSGIVAACSSGSSGTAGAPADTQAFIGQFCDLFAPCCAMVNKPADGAACRALYGALIGASQYDAARGTSCLEELRAQQTAPDFCKSATASAPSCKSVFKASGGGTKGPGEDCSKDGDCASSVEGTVSCASSFGSNGAETKVCQVEVDGKEGDTPCIATRDGNVTHGTSSFTSGDAGPPRPPSRGYVCDLAAGIYCASATKSCARVEEVGGPCDTRDSSYGCVKTAFCDSTTRKCAPRLAVGADCSKSSTSCVAKASCDRTTKLCVATLADGAPCTTGDQCESDHCVNGACDASSSGDLSTQLLCGN